MSIGTGPSTACLAVLTWALAVLLAACGPGVGGTGSGEPGSTLQPGSAVPGSVCTSDLAALLGCVGSGSAATPLLTLDLVDTIDGRQVRVHLHGNEVEVEVPCARLRFSGRWGTVDGQPAAYHGTATVEAASLNATLRVQLSEGGVVVQLQDAQGGTLLGPLPLVAVATPPPMACG